MRVVAYNVGPVDSLVWDAGEPVVDEPHRQTTLDAITAPLHYGRELAVFGAITVYVLGEDRFSVRVYPAEVEEGPPRGPMLCGVTREEAKAEGWVAKATAEIEAMVGRMGWELPVETRAYLPQALSVVSRAEQVKRAALRPVIVVIVAAAIMAALLTWAADGNF